MANRVQDSMFIDMKYIVLYRKLGFREIESDIFVFEYADAQIRIETEAQRFLLNDEWYPLLTYKDMVKLECVDRLLKRGYSAKNIVEAGGFDLCLKDNNMNIFVLFLFDEWGKKYDKLLSEFKYNATETVVLYTSQLSGGLIDYKSQIYTPNGVYDEGLFERYDTLYPQKFYKAEDNVASNSLDFVIKGTELIKYVGSNTEVVVPRGIKRIGMGAFWNNTTIASVTLPDGLECIAGDAFVYCENLQRITIPSTVEAIGDNPFAGCPHLIIDNLSKSFIWEDGILFDKNKKSLIHYTPSKKNDVYIIPETVEWIGKHSFYKCENLKKIVINQNASYMGNNAFSDCTNVSLENRSPYFKYIDGVLYNSDLTQVYHYSLGSGITDVVLQNGVRTIGRNSFWNAKTIKTITIPQSVRQIGYNPFAYCLNAEFVVLSPKYTNYNGVLYTADFRELVCCTAKVIKDGTVELHESLESIGRNAFTGCESLEQIELPSTIKAVARGAFSGCKRLKEITIPQSVEFVGDWVFNNCTALEKLRIPQNIHLENNALKNCTAKVEIY
jgi:hypothetical protein